MSSLSSLEKRKLELLFDMGSGYVLDFTDATFAEFFRTTCGINIDDEKYRFIGTSKAKRLRAFWELEPDQIVGTILNEMILISQHILSTTGKDSNNTVTQECKAIARRLTGDKIKTAMTEEDFLKVQYDNFPVVDLDIEQALVPILEGRIKEAFQCKNSKSSLSTIFMCGSVLEGLLLGAATKYPKEFNQSTAAPMADGKPKQFHEWKLGQFIDASHELGFLPLDVKKFSHVLRDFRNYIHPYEQVASGFSPDEHTADICLQVLKAAIAALSKSKFRKGAQA